MEVRVSNSQMFFTYVLIVGHSFGLPTFLIKELEQDFWQPILIASVVEFIVAWFLYKMGTYYSRQTIYQYCEKIVGKMPGKIATLLLVSLFIGIACLFTVSVCEFFSSIIMPETPIEVFVITMLLVSTYAVYAGIEVIMRLVELLGFIFILSILAMVVFNIKWFEFGNLLPVFQHDLTEVIHSLPLPIAWFGTCVVMGVLMAYQNQGKDALKVKIGGAFLGMFLLFTVTFTSVLVLGVELSQKQNYPAFMLARMVVVGDFIERLEALQVVAWTATSFYAIAIFQFAGVEGMRQLMPKKSRVLLIFISALLIVFISLVLFPLSKDSFQFSKTLLTTYFLWIEIGTVLIIFVVWFGKEKLRKWKKRMSQ